LKNIRICLYLVLFLLIGLVSSSAQAGEVLKGFSLAAKTVTGYGEYKLGTPVSQLNLKDFIGPLRDNSYREIEAYGYVKETKFHSSVSPATKMNVTLTTLEGKLELITLDFPQLLVDLKDLDAVADFVRYLRESVVAKYDPELVKVDFFNYSVDLSDPDTSWSGGLLIRGEEGNQLFLTWKGYDLSIYYMSAKALARVTKAESRAQEEDVGKL